QFTRRVTGSGRRSGVLVAPGARVLGEIVRSLLQGVGWIRQTLLLAGHPPERVRVLSAFLLEALDFTGDAALRVRELLRFELELAGSTLARVRRPAAHLLLEPS